MRRVLALDVFFLPMKNLRCRCLGANMLYPGENLFDRGDIPRLHRGAHHVASLRDRATHRVEVREWCRSVHLSNRQHHRALLLMAASASRSTAASQLAAN